MCSAADSAAIDIVATCRTEWALDSSSGSLADSGADRLLANCTLTLFFWFFGYRFCLFVKGFYKDCFEVKII